MCVERVFSVRARWPVPTSTCVVGSWSAGWKLGGEAPGRPVSSGRPAGEGNGRTVEFAVNPVDASLFESPARWDVGAGCRDWPLGSGRRRPVSDLGRDEHRRPRGIEGAHPGRSSCVRNAETPSGSGPFAAGKPTARRAQLPGGQRMTEKRMPVAERCHVRGSLGVPGSVRPRREGGRAFVSNSIGRRARLQAARPGR